MAGRIDLFTSYFGGNDVDQDVFFFCKSSLANAVHAMNYVLAPGSGSPKINLPAVIRAVSDEQLLAFEAIYKNFEVEEKSAFGFDCPDALSEAEWKWLDYCFCTPGVWLEEVKLHWPDNALAGFEIYSLDFPVWYDCFEASCVLHCAAASSFYYLNDHSKTAVLLEAAESVIRAQVWMTASAGVKSAGQSNEALKKKKLQRDHAAEWGRKFVVVAASMQAAKQKTEHPRASDYDAEIAALAAPFGVTMRNKQFSARAAADWRKRYLELDPKLRKQYEADGRQALEHLRFA